MRRTTCRAKNLDNSLIFDRLFPFRRHLFCEDEMHYGIDDVMLVLTKCIMVSMTSCLLARNVS